MGGSESIKVAPAWDIREGFLEEVTSKLEKGVGEHDHIPGRRKSMNKSLGGGGAWRVQGCVVSSTCLVGGEQEEMCSGGGVSASLHPGGRKFWLLGQRKDSLI